MQENNQVMEARLNASRQEISTLQQNLDEIRAESMTDPLSGLGNRKFFDRQIDRLTDEARKSDEPLTLLLLDIDHFKSFNDNYGHLTGDQVLRLVAQTLRQNVKGRDVTARYGGEEFAVLLPATPMRQALTVADNIRRAVMSKELKKKVDRRDPRPRHHLDRRCRARRGRRSADADRPRRRLPLCGQAQRPQPRHLRDRSRISARPDRAGGLRI